MSAAKATYYRNQKGTVAHLATCPKISTLHSPPWHWAEGLSGPQLEKELLSSGAIAWIRQCSICRPFEGAQS